MKKFIKKMISFFRKKEKIPVIKTVDNKNILENRVALITGGSGGIGYAIAKKFVRSGAKVIITGRNEDKLQQCCNKIGGECKYVVLDQNDIKSLKIKIEEIVKIYGKVDILVNNAGTHIARDNLEFINITEDEYDDVMNLNLKSTFFITQLISKYMIDNNIRGNILMISSSRALEPAWSPYGISKLGIKGMTSGIAKILLKYNIVVNGIAPGPTATSMQSYNEGDSIYTDQTLLERYTLPDEIAEYATLLVSELGNTIIGDTIYMSGGRGIIEMR